MYKPLLIIAIVIYTLALGIFVCTIPIRWQAWDKRVPGYPLVYALYNIYTKKKHTAIKLNRKVCFENLEVIRKVFEKTGITKWWVAEGSALGIKREQNLIEWDDDVDITVDFETHFESFLDTTYRELRRSGFMHVLNSHEFPMLCFIRNGEKVDISFFSKTLRKCSEGFMSGEQLAPLVSNIESVRCTNGFSYPIPIEDAYYEALYGPNWKTPKRNSKSNKGNQAIELNPIKTEDR